MNILAIDTSSNLCSVAILQENVVVDEINLDNGKTHSENLMPMVAEILERNHFKLSDMELICCSVGPGSFTGIRIGVASVKAMAQMNEIPVVGVTSLETLARMDTSSKIKVSLIDARNNQVYCGIFDQEYHLIQELMADDVVKVLQTLETLDDFVCIGTGALLHKELILEHIPKVEFFVQNEQKASYAGLIAYQKYLANDVQNADTLMPIYLRKSQAERNKGK